MMDTNFCTGTPLGGWSVSIVLEKYFSSEANQKSEFSILPNVISIDKEKTIATKIKWLGDIFIRLLNMIAIPLVLASLTVGAASLGDIKKFPRIGGKTLAFYLTTTAIAISIGLVAANLIQPGERMNTETKVRLLSVYSKYFEARVDRILDMCRTVTNITGDAAVAVASSEGEILPSDLKNF